MEAGVAVAVQVRSIKWTDMAWKSLAEAQAELRTQCGKPPGFSVPDQPTADVFAMFDTVPQPARHWFYVADDTVTVRALPFASGLCCSDCNCACMR